MKATPAEEIKTETRSDRRDFSWRTVIYGFLFSRRREHRRDEDSEVVFLDLHHPWIFFLSVGTMLLSVADAFLTLRLMAFGMIEVNPIMNSLMSMGTGVFVSAKLLLTAFGIFVLVYLAKARFMNRVKCGLFLTMFFSFYAVLVCYELVNLFDLM